MWTYTETADIIVCFRNQGIEIRFGVIDDGSRINEEYQVIVIFNSLVFTDAISDNTVLRIW